MTDFNAPIVGLLLECPRCGDEQAIRVSHLDLAVSVNTKMKFIWCSNCSVPIVAGWTAEGIPWARMARNSDKGANL